jgi:hypothetical protein
VCKWKSETCENSSRNGGGGIKENDGGVNSTMIYCKNFCKGHNVPPSSTTIIKILKEGILPSTIQVAVISINGLFNFHAFICLFVLFCYIARLAQNLQFAMY